VNSGKKKVGYIRRVPDMDSTNTRFSDIDTNIFIFGLNTGNTWIVQLRI
jgi:hypothetical protein